MTAFARNYVRRPLGLFKWDKPRPEETAHGLMLRLAEMHHHASTTRTERTMGVSRPRLAHGFADEIKRFAAGVRQPASAFVADSPIRDEKGRVHVRGHHVADFLMFGVRRVCPGCLAESMHHRFWWDIRPVTTCPRHGLALIDACPCGAKFGWRGGGLVCCTVCGNRNLTRLARLRADPRVSRADDYLLSRFAAAAPQSVPILDPLDISNLFGMLERVGAAAEGGYHRDWQSAKSLGIPLAQIQARGFEVLADGRLDEVLTKIYDGFIAAGGRPEEGFSSCYGWFYHWFNHKRGARFSPLLAEAFLAHGADRFPIAPKVRLGILPKPARRKLSLKDAAAACGTSAFAMKSIGLALGVIRTEKRSGSSISFPVEAVEQVARDLKGARSLAETQRDLGVGYRVIHGLMEAELLTPALRGGRRHKHVYIFRQGDAQALLKKLSAGVKVVSAPSPALIALSQLGRSRPATVAGCARLIVDGKLRIHQRVERLTGLQSLFVDHAELMSASGKSLAGGQIQRAAAVRKMRLNARGFSKAIAIGLFPGVKHGDRGIPAALVEDFVGRYMMLGEVREHIPGWFPTLREMLQRMGFAPDPDLVKCMHAGYPRKEMEAFLAKVAAGKVSLERPDAARESAIAATRHLLAAASEPVSSDDLLRALREKIRLGPSDQDQFFFATMWEEKADFVFIVGAGWWLRSRSYLGRTWPADAKTASHHDIVEETVIDFIRGAKTPVTPEQIVEALDRRRIRIPAADRVVYFRRLVKKHRDKIAKLTGLGYWDRSRPYPPALYDPKTCRSGVQTAAARIGAWVVKHLEDTGRPAGHVELTAMLQEHGVMPSSTNPRNYLSVALEDVPDDIVRLRGVGYWLKRKPWTRADYRPARRKAAA